MVFANQQLGRDGEDIAVAFLRSKGAKIIERNWRPAQKGMRGEIDVITQYREFTCFVEVKTRKSDAMGSPQEAVGNFKRRQISRLANAYLSFLGNDEIPCRFDIVEVWLVAGQKPRVQWIENAFDFEI
ncbi:YraN family protein [bacterium]|nr:MAG: YraN family protein [bacterium]